MLNYHLTNRLNNRSVLNLMHALTDALSLSSDHEKESASVSACIKFKQMPIEQQKCVERTFERTDGKRQTFQVQSHKRKRNCSRNVNQ